MNRHSVSAADVAFVAMRLNFNPSISEIDEVLVRYPSYQDADETSNWSEVVEELLYELNVAQIKVFNYKGVKYPSRTFNVLLEGKERQYVIAPESLFDAMGDDWEDTTTKASRLDDEIYMYLPEETFNLNGEEICKNHLDVPMKFISEE